MAEQALGRLLPSHGFSQQDGCGCITCLKSESAVSTSVVKKTAVGASTITVILSVITGMPIARPACK